MSPLPGAVATQAGANALPCPVIAISMRPAFWERLQRQLAGMGQHDSILCQATDGNRIDVAAWVAQGRWQPPADDGVRPMTRGELGCSDSHRRAWSYVVEAALPGALVLEDDADLPADLPQWLNEAWPYRGRWHVLYLGHTGWAPALPIEGVPQFQIPLIAHAWNVTHAYLVTQDGARVLLQDALPIRSPVDVYMARLTVAGLLAWQSARPVVATREDTYSSTQGIR